MVHNLLKYQTVEKKRLCSEHVGLNKLRSGCARASASRLPRHNAAWRISSSSRKPLTAVGDMSSCFQQRQRALWSPSSFGCATFCQTWQPTVNRSLPCSVPEYIGCDQSSRCEPIPSTSNGDLSQLTSYPWHGSVRNALILRPRSTCLQSLRKFHDNILTSNFPEYYAGNCVTTMN